GERLIVALLHGGKTRIFRRASQLHRLKQQRRLFEREKDEYHGANEENEELHRDLRQCVEQQSQPALGNRLSSEIALHLGLIATEVGQRQERSADKPAPYVVAVVPIEVRGHGVQSSGGAHQRNRFGQ